MMQVQRLASWLADEGLEGFTYQADGYDPAGNVFLDWHPDQPDLSVCLMGRPGSVDDAGYGYDRVVVQVITRGPAGGQAQAWQLCEDIRLAVTGLHSVDLAEGVTVVRAWAWEGQPTAMGNDDAGRPEYTVHLELELTQPTGLRPLG
jgi:hypothetical protein